MLSFEAKKQFADSLKARVRFFLKSKRKITISLIILLALVLGYAIFSPPSKYQADLVSSTKLGLVGKDFFNQRTDDNLDATNLNSDNILLDNRNYLMHFRLTSNTNGEKNIKFYLPKRKGTFKVAGAINHDYRTPLRGEFTTVKSGYIETANMHLNKLDYFDIWLVYTCIDHDSLTFLMNSKNYHFLINFNEIVNFPKTIDYFEKIDSYYYDILNIIYQWPIIQMILFILTIYGIFTSFVFFKKITNHGFDIFNKTTLRTKLTYIVAYLTLFIGIYNAFIPKQLNEEDIEIYSSPSEFIPSIPIYDLSAISLGTMFEFDTITLKSDLKRPMTIPTAIKIDTLFEDFSYISSYTIKTKQGRRIPEVTILTTNSADNKYFSNYQNGISTTKKINDTITVLKGFVGQNSFRLFSKRPIEDDELEFHTLDRVYKITHELKNIGAFNFIDFTITRILINSFFLQMIVLFFCYFGFINLGKIIYRNISLLKQNEKSS